MAGGIDNRKLSLLLAILEKRCGYPVSSHDVFVSIAGGLKVTEPAVDLAVITAIASSLTNKPVDGRLMVTGEVGLSGEVRPVTHIERRISEAGKLGFSRILCPRAANFSQPKQTTVLSVESVPEALEAALA